MHCIIYYIAHYNYHRYIIIKCLWCTFKEPAKLGVVVVQEKAQLAGEKTRATKAFTPF